MCVCVQFAIITCIERLEKAYVKGGIDPTEYETVCRRLLGQFKTLSRSLASTVPDPMKFMDEYGMDCSAAREVIHFGEPSTVRFNIGAGQGDDDSLYTLQVGEALLTVVEITISGEQDAAVMLACDNIKGYVNDVLRSLNKVNLPPEFDRSRLHYWIEHLNKMQAWEHLTSQEARQLRADMEDLKDRFHHTLAERQRR